jgi:hypothetical protein
MGVNDYHAPANEQLLDRANHGPFRLCVACYKWPCPCTGELATVSNSKACRHWPYSSINTNGYSLPAQPVLLLRHATTAERQHISWWLITWLPVTCVESPHTEAKKP